MPQTRAYKIGFFFEKKQHCIHTHKVKKKQGNVYNKTSTIILLPLSHPLEVNMVFTYNHVINSVESLSFWRVDKGVREELLNLFRKGIDYDYVAKLFQQYRKAALGGRNG